MAAPPLHETLRNDGPVVFYTADFRRLIEDHLDYLKQNNRSTPISIAEKDLHKYEYDLFGLLVEYELPRHLHWIVMRLNGMTSPDQFTELNTSLLIPDPSEIDRLKDIQMSVHKIA